MINSEHEDEDTQRAIEELLSNILSPRPRVPNSVLDAQVRNMQEFHSTNSLTGAQLGTKREPIALSTGIAPNEEVARLKTIPPQWIRDQLESIRDVSLDNDIGCWLSSTPTTVKPYHAHLDLSHTIHTSGQDWADFKEHRKRLAIAAKGEASLLAVLPFVCRISNLCHNSNCFQPEHVEVEPDELVAARKE